MPDEVSDCFDKYFFDLCGKVANSIESSNYTFAEYLNHTSINSTLSFQRVDSQLVYNLLQTISHSKATVVDKIPGKILKLAAPVIAQSLTKLFYHSIIATETFPSEWKIAKVIPLHKSEPPITALFLFYQQNFGKNSLWAVIHLLQL